MNKILLASLIIIICFLCMGALQAQNLVLNPSFENSSSCPQGISEFYLCTNWSTTTTTASDSCSTPDLYAACSSVIGGVNVPNCLLGYHQARTGTHFAGIILGDAIPATCIPSGDDYREYLEGTLSAPLIAGQKYLVVFYASLAEASTWGSNSLGVYFSNTQYTHDACPNSIIKKTPQLEMCGAAIMDTVNWIPVQWIYTATGGEQNFIIGNFNTDGNTDHVAHDCSSFNSYIYYYIDDVSVTPYGAGDSSSAANHDCAISIETDSVNATCGASDGSALATVRGCSTPFLYKWSNGGTGTSLSNVPAGQYTLSVTDANNCVQTVSVSVNSTSLKLDQTATNPGCGISNGTVTVTATNGTGPFNYNWSNSATGSTISNLGAGTYVVTVTGAPGCRAVDSLSLLAASAITITPQVTNAGCANNNGSITANINGGAGPYTYNWSNGQTTQTINGLSAGIYTLTAIGDTNAIVVWSENFSGGGNNWTLNTPGTGANGGDANQWVVNNDNNCTCASGKYLHITCNPASFYCLLQGGTCTYLEFPSALGFGDYTTDVLAISPVISTVGKANLTLSFTYLSLGNPGQDYGVVNLSKDGGATWTALPTQYSNIDNCTQENISIPIAYQNISNFRIAFEWINTGGSITGNLANPPGFAINDISLTAAGSNCPAVASATVAEASNISLSLTPTQPTCGQGNGAIAARVDSGTGPFTYSWNTGATTQALSNLGTGYYIVTVTGAGGCISTDSVSLFNNNSLLLTLTDSVAECGNNNGSASVSVQPTGNYSFLWSNGATTAAISNLSAGPYGLTVTGQGGCTGIDSLQIATSGQISVSNNSTVASCGQNNGSASVTVSPQGTYSYLWSNGETTASISNLAGASYMLTITGGGCTKTDTVQVAATSALTVQNNSTIASCGLSNGSASVTVLPQAAYNYLWSDGETTASISNLAGASYTVTITGGGCSKVDTVVVQSSSSLTVQNNSTNASCGQSNGTASVSVSPQGTYTYLWSNGETSADITNLAGNSYTVTITGGGCSAIDTVLIAATSSLTVQNNLTNANCGQSNGSASVSVLQPGTYSYLWSNGATTSSISNLAGATYTVTITGGGCSAIDTIKISPVISLTIINHSINASCGQNDGSVSVSVSPQGAYTYLWNNGATTTSISNLAAGSYMITITSGGCYAFDTLQVFGISSITVQNNAFNTSCGLNNGAASVIASPPGNYNYLWSTGATTSIITNLAASTYTLTITGTGGCVTLDTIQVEASSAIAVFTSVTGTTCGNNNGSALVSASGGSGSLSYLWSNGNTSVALSNLAPGTYLVTVSDAGGCNATDSVVVNTSGVPVQIAADKTTICAGDSTQLCVPAGYLSYSWNNGDKTNCITVSEPGNYYLTVTDNGNCTASSNRITVNFYPSQPVSVNISGDTIAVDLGVAYTWYLNGTLLPGIDTNVYIAQQSGEYKVGISDTNGCTIYSNPFEVVVNGINQIFDNSFVSVYPNPSSATWQMDLSDDWIGGLAELFDNNGRLVSRFEIADKKSAINVRVEPGVYILRLSSQWHTMNFKLVKI